ncbi:hypothetical protein PCE1_004386 [Barthelona sp. PCE]
MLWEPTSKAREKYNFELAYTSWEQVLESLNERSTSQSIKTSGTKLKKGLSYHLFAFHAYAMKNIMRAARSRRRV